MKKVPSSTLMGGKHTSSLKSTASSGTGSTTAPTLPSQGISKSIRILSRVSCKLSDHDKGSTTLFRFIFQGDGIVSRSSSLDVVTTNWRVIFLCICGRRLVRERMFSAFGNSWNWFLRINLICPTVKSILIQIVILKVIMRFRIQVSFILASFVVEYLKTKEQWIHTWELVTKSNNVISV